MPILTRSYAAVFSWQWEHSNQRQALLFPELLRSRLITQAARELPAQRDTMPRHSHRVPLGLLMLSRGELDVVQLQRALQAQRQSGTGYIGEWLLRLGFAREQQIASALAAQWSCPVLHAFPQHPQLSTVPSPLLEAFAMAPAYYIESTKTMYGFRRKDRIPRVDVHRRGIAVQSDTLHDRFERARKHVAPNA